MNDAEGFRSRRYRPATGKRVTVTMGRDVKPQSIVWLWPGWLARGKLHVLAGRPAALKTAMAIGFAAAVTLGGQWPDGSRATPGKVVIWSGEDAIDDTLLPRRTRPSIWVPSVPSAPRSAPSTWRPSSD
jgi:hypothetical protein